MKILITGATGVIGAGLVPQLLEQGHQVRLLSRHAREDSRRWPGVETFEADVADRDALRGAAEGCAAVIHIAGIVREQPPEQTFERLNVDGTAAMIEEAGRAGALRFIFVSSLGADRGTSRYHQSKRGAERLVEESGLRWTIVRPGNVYGPGDEVISLVLKMVRALPAFPVVDDGDQQFQPIWYEDLGAALATVLERDELAGRTIEIAGEERTSLNDLLDRFSEITERRPLRIPVPMPLASIAAKLISHATDSPLDETKLTMLREENVIEGDGHDLRMLVGGEPTTLDRGLRMLADALPEQLPEEGVGTMERKRFWAEIRGGRLTPPELMSLFCERVTDIMPIDFAAEPGVPTRIEQGATLTGALPIRGNIQVRVEVCEPTRVVFATIEGHPLAGIVQFSTEESGDGVRFAIDIHARAANSLDLVAMKTVGRPAQNANWEQVVMRMVEASGGESDGVHQESLALSEEEAAEVEKRIRRLVQRRQSEEVREGVSEGR
jgi:NADH dehydrogenase